MTLEFILAVAALLLLAASILLWPLLRRRRDRGVQRSALTVELYRQRMAELEQEWLAGMLDKGQFDSASRELEYALICDVDGAGSEPARAARPGGRGTVTLLTAAVALPVLAIAMHLHLAPSVPDTASVTEASAPADDPETLEMRRMVAELADRMADDPGDAEGWLMLARGYRFLDSHTRAVRAFERAHELVGDDAALLMDYADALVMAADGEVTARARDLTRRTLEIDPANQHGLWLAGVSHFQVDEYARAAGYWERLLATLPTRSEAAEHVRYAADTATLLSGDASGRPGAAPGGTVFDVDIRLDETLLGGLNGDEMVLIYARAIEGSSMPLAVARSTVAELPAGIRLDATNAMLDGVSLEDHPDVEVVARVSRSGEAISSSGDLQGSSGPLATGRHQTIDLAIDTQIP